MSAKVPQPVAEYNNAEALDIRTKLIMEYGEGTVQWAEIAVVVQLMFSVGIIKPQEFIELVVHQCKRTDDRRRQAAGYRD